MEDSDTYVHRAKQIKTGAAFLKFYFFTSTVVVISHKSTIIMLICVWLQRVWRMFNNLKLSLEKTKICWHKPTIIIICH